MKSSDAYPFIKWFADITIADIPLVGGKNASLGEMVRELAANGVKVPDGFAITADAFRHFIREARLDDGDTVNVSVKDGAIVVRPARPTYSIDDLVAKITRRNHHEPTDWGAAPVGRELW